MLAWLLAAESQGASTPITEPLLQYGAIGAIAAICIYAVYKLFSSLEASHKAESDRVQAERKAELERIQAAHKAELERIQVAHTAAIERADAAYDREVARGDRLEGELSGLNKLVNDKLAGELVRATDAIREAFETMHEQRRRL